MPRCDFNKVEIRVSCSPVTVFNFQSMKTPVELNSLLSKYFSYITSLDATMDDLQTRPLVSLSLFYTIRDLGFVEHIK